MFKNKKGKSTNIEDLVKIVFLLIIIYFLLKAFGLIQNGIKCVT